MFAVIGLVLASLLYASQTGVLDIVKPSKSMNLVDCTAEDQQGGFTTTYDWAFDRAHSAMPDVPWALMKAHAVRESALKPDAFRQEPSGKASYGLMQVLWWKDSNRFMKYGYPDDDLNGGEKLYEADTNAIIAAHIISENLKRFGNLRDSINAYNTGVAESVRVAPHNYVDDVLKYYSKITGESVT